jgi:hypothetical protein
MTAIIQSVSGIEGSRSRQRSVDEAFAHVRAYGERLAARPASLKAINIPARPS